MLHIQITIMILFGNIFATLAVPDLILSDNPFYEVNSQTGEYEVNNNIVNNVDNLNDNPTIFDNLTSSYSILELLTGVIDLLISIAFALPILMGSMNGLVAFIVGVPLFVAYAFAIWGFIR